MIKGFVSGEEKDIVRIPMKGKNLFDGEISAQDVGMTGSRYGFTISGAGTYTVSIEGSVETGDFCYLRIFSDGTYSDSEYLTTGTHRNKITKTILEGETIIVFNASGSQTLNQSKVKFERWKVMVSEGDERIPYEPYGYQEGWEVRDSQDRIIWGREDELQTATGTLPFKGYGLPVKVKSLLGNAVQNGTPAPDNIVTPEMCGVRRANVMPFAAAQTITSNGITFESDGKGGYTVKGYSTAAASAVFQLSDTFIIPNSVGNGGNGTLSFWNTKVDSVVFGFMFNDTVIDEWSMLAVNRQHNAYSIIANQKCNAIRLYVAASKSCDQKIQPELTDNGEYPTEFEPYGWKIPFENHGENLFDAAAAYGVMYSNGTISGELSALAGVKNTFPSELLGQQITISVKANSIQSNRAYIRCDIGGTNIDSNAVTQGNTGTMTVTVTPTSLSDKWWLTYGSGTGNNTFSDLMLNLGSTPKPYSPYLNATIPVYLGEVPTVRRVRKLVLTGEEDWEAVSNDNTKYYRMVIGDYDYAEGAIGICTHYKCDSVTSSNYNVAFYIAKPLSISKSCLNIRPTNVSSTTVNSFKRFLADEYSAGHPVTVWYVTSEPETTISNEPLCKISTYADELTTIQAHGLSAPLYGIGDYKDMLNLSTGVVTRKVKKLVLDGTETIGYYNGVIYLMLPDDAMNDTAIPSSTHYIGTNLPSSESPNYSVRQMVTGYWGGSKPAMQIKDSSHSSSGLFQDFLASQYRAGHPVTVWYILSTPETETVTVPTGMTGEIEGYLTQVSTPSPTNRSVPKWNGVEETGGTYAVTVYTPPEIPTTTGQNTLTVDSNLAPSKLEVSIHAKRIHYGFKIDKSNDDSDSAVIYTHDAVTMTPAHMDFTNDRFDYGSWGNAFFVRDCYPVALNLDGTIAYRLDPDDYTKKTDGTPSDIFYELLTAAPSDWSTQWKQYYTKSGDEYVLNDQSTAPTFAQDTYYKLTYNSSFTGNFMMAFPKVWFYRHEDSQYNYIEISNYKLSDDWKCYAHINASGQEVDFIYLPLFKGVIKDSKLRSLPGQIPQGNTTATDEVNAATALGSRWQIWDHSSVECLNDLLTLMSKSIDSQGRFGQGRSDGYDSTDTVTYGKLQSGTLIKKGKFHGYSSDYNDVKVFGIEGFWSNRWDRLQGMLLVNNVWKIKMTPPYNFTGTDFVTLSNASVPTGNGYLSKVQTSEYGSIPASIANGSSTKYFKDYFNKSTTDTRVALRGGLCLDGDYAGFRFVSMDCLVSYSGWTIGASPVYK